MLSRAAQHTDAVLPGCCICRAIPSAENSARAVALRRLHAVTSRRTAAAVTSGATGATTPPRIHHAVPRAAVNGKAKKAHQGDTQVHDDSEKLAIRRQSPKDPFAMADKARALCRAGQAEQAVTLLRHGKREARNAAVYNILVHELLVRQENKLAWTAWMDMKRSQIRPTPRSYTTFFSSFDPSSVTPASLETIRTVHAQWQKQTAGLSSSTSTSPSEGSEGPQAASPIPTNAFLTLLSRTPLVPYSEVLRVLRSLPRTGPLAPDKETYTIVLHSLVHAAKSPSLTDEQLADIIADFQDLWKDLKLAVMRRKICIDARCFTATMQLWRTLDQKAPKSIDRAAALDDIGELTGIDPKVEPAEAPSPPLVKMDAVASFNALVLANLFSNKNQKLGYKWFEKIRSGQVVVEPDSLASRHAILAMRSNPDAAEELLVWLIRQPSLACRPEVFTYEAAMQCSNFTGALRVLAHCTGRNDELLVSGERRLLELPAQATKDGQPLSRRMLKGRHTKTVAPTTVMINALFEKALDTRDWRRQNRAIAIAKELGFLENLSKLGSDEASSKFKAHLLNVMGKLSDRSPVSTELQPLYRRICEDLGTREVVSRKIPENVPPKGYRKR